MFLKDETRLKLNAVHVQPLDYAEYIRYLEKEIEQMKA